jgi:hypothetical protein
MVPFWKGLILLNYTICIYIYNRYKIYASIAASVIRETVCLMFFQPSSPSSLRSRCSARSQYG